MEEHSNAAVDGPTWVLIPMFNEASSIGVVISDLRRHFDHVLCVDDGSSDDSTDVAGLAGATVVRHPINLGQGAALQTGFEYLQRHTSAAYAVTFDADGQHLADDAHRMVLAARQHGLDVVLASRFLGEVHDMPASRRLVLRAAVWLSRRTSGLPLTDTHNGLRVLSRHAFLHPPPSAAHGLRQRARGRDHAPRAQLPRGAGHGRVHGLFAAKGQRNVNAINIVFELVAHRMRALP